MDYAKFFFLALAALVLFCPVPTECRTFYIDSSLGSDSNNYTIAQNSETPWRSLWALNGALVSHELTLQSGDQILFARGQNYSGMVGIASMVGSSSGGIYIGSYGNPTSAAPLLKGTAQIDPVTWTNIGGNIWSTILLPAPKFRPMVFQNGQRLTFARFPNVDPITRKSQFTRFQNPLNSTYWTDTNNAAQATGYWINATAIIRSCEYVYLSTTIDNYYQSNSTFHIPAAIYGGITANAGYYLEGPDIAQLDSAGEYFYDASTGTLSVWSLNSDSPSNYLIEYENVTNAFLFSTADYVTIDGISFWGHNQQAIQAGYFNNGSVINCNFSTALRGIYISNSAESTFDNLIITDMTGEGFHAQGVQSTISNSTIYNIGLLEGSGYLGCCGGSTGLYVNGLNINMTGFIVTRNIVYNTGYIGISHYGPGHIITYNHVHDAMQTLSDGGAIYSYASTSTNVTIAHNIAHDTYGNNEWYLYPPPVHGNAHCYYFDDMTNGYLVFNNTGWNCPDSCIFLHEHHNSRIFYNNFYNCTDTMILVFEQFYFNESFNNILWDNVIVYSSFNNRQATPVVSENSAYAEIINYPQYDNTILDFYGTPLYYNKFIGRVPLDGFAASTGRCNDTLSPISTPVVIDIIQNYTVPQYYTPGKWGTYPAGTTLTGANTTFCTNCMLLEAPPSSSIPNALCNTLAPFMTLQAGVPILISFNYYSNVTFLTTVQLIDSSNYSTVVSWSLTIVANTSSTYYSLGTPSGSCASCRLDFNVPVSHMLYFWNLTLHAVQINTQNYTESIYYNPTFDTVTVQLPNGNQYADPFGNLVTYSMELQPFGSQILVYQGYNASLFVPPSTPAPTQTPSPTGSSSIVVLSYCVVVLCTLLHL